MRIETETWTTPDHPNPVTNAMLEAGLVFKYIAEYPANARRFLRWQRNHVPGTWHPSPDQLHSMYHVFADMVSSYVQMEVSGIQVVPTPESEELLKQFRLAMFGNMVPESWDVPGSDSKSPDTGPTPYL